MYQHFPFSIWFTNQCIDCNGLHVNDNQKLSANAPPCHIIGATRQLLIAINKSCRQCGSLLISALDNSFSVSTLYSQFPPYARICIQKAISQQLLWELFSPLPSINMVCWATLFLCLLSDLVAFVQKNKWTKSWKLATVEKKGVKGAAMQAMKISSP